VTAFSRTERLVLGMPVCDRILLKAGVVSTSCCESCGLHEGAFELDPKEIRPALLTGGTDGEEGLLYGEAGISIDDDVTVTVSMASALTVARMLRFTMPNLCVPALFCSRSPKFAR